jgi:hypothetical protein
MRYFLRVVSDCRASVSRFEDAQNPDADRGLEWKQSLVEGRQCRGLLITNGLTEAGCLYYIKAFLVWGLLEMQTRIRLVNCTWLLSRTLSLWSRDELTGYPYSNFRNEDIHLKWWMICTRGHRYNTDYYRSGGYVCPSLVNYARPKRAQNVRGHWKVIVNLADEQNIPPEYRRFTQTHRIEQCTWVCGPFSKIGEAT